jgi:hypothetical protein
MKDMITEVIAPDPRFVHAVKTLIGEWFLDSVWVQISIFFGRDYIGTPLRPDQVWVVN